MRNKKVLSKPRYKANISKDELSKLPTEKFSGEIIVIDNVEDIDSAVKVLEKSQFLGIDTESKPVFKVGSNSSISLIQIANEECCYLFRVNKTGITPELISILENENIYKIGLSLRDDIKAISKIEKFIPKGFVELQRLCSAYGIKELGLQRIYGIIFKRYLSKGQRLSNWEAGTLSPAQQNYAALDAWVCLRIYNTLLSKANPNPINFAIIE